ncbi:hypothetical protein [Hymenobacter terrenus]|uniref:hypothetical protein n=1 Tax=Hymenobacter terrenus TaxID=1629124 RepID=UPI000696E7DE|nr:hypothetical protein [Hymenobacter terrenus]
MKGILRTLLAASAVVSLPLAASQAQTRKPAPKSVAKPGAKPVVKPAPVAKPAPAAPARAATPPAPAAAPAAEPARSASASATGGTGPFEVGTNAVNLGVGLGNRYGYDGGFFGGNSSVSPAISLSYERGIIPLGPGVLGVGGFIGYQGASYNFGGGDKIKFTDIVVTLRGAFHYNFIPELDTYGGLGLGVRRLGSSGEGLFSQSANYGGTDAVLGLFVGGRYFFTPSIGAFAELGYDQSYLKVGLTAKF